MNSKLPNYTITPSSDGSFTLYTDKYDAHYHSIYGALEESIHVFISAGLFHKLRQGHSHINIFEMGFGTGLNAYLTFLESKRFNLTIDYQTVESDPLDLHTVANFNYHKLLNQNDDSSFLSMHKLPWNTETQLSPQFSINKIQEKIEDLTFNKSFDLIYYDAFAPSCQPHLWQEHIHQKLFNSLNPGGCLVTYCTQGAFKRLLKTIGYKNEILNGPAKKREMLRAVKPRL